MKALVINKFGDPSVFEITEIPKPKVVTGHVVIHVRATSVNPIDTKVRAGFVPAVAPEFPAVLHGDVAGVVAEVGEGVTEFQVGDEVYGCAGGFKGTGGALAEYMLADVNLLAHKPKNLTMAQAAALPLVTITAWESLYNRANVQKDQTVLVHGATGGVGHIGIQLAKLAGAKVFTTGSSDEKLSIGKRLGADKVINYREQSVEEYIKENTDGKGFDVVFDTVGGDNLNRSFEAAATYGTVVAIAARSTHDLSPLHAKALSLHITFMLLKVITKDQRQEYGEILKEVTKLVEAGKLVPLVDEKVFTFDQVNEAHSLLESNKAVGKVVLVNEW
ncbi:MULTISPECIES: zinc-dependent alcohol dehydrogenase family protein [Sutcliffiella]|uniref:Quinone oxidoreductase n=1 Tax=Sutcliffiella cohnii TaxID=33932 RepID=A0A223KND0_9BACI|nr:MULTISPECIES: zinc-dependent alcohol dehydrogenase family protein [Sutcliffiella]AST91010.1 quinone oxidoreductase [Sutcliffiella cohnii]WBL16805.1 zinc-dependent alcohol dehydrogenase family protein [Sutcliffiella sp. NC1]